MGGNPPGQANVERLLAALDHALEVTADFAGPVEVVQGETTSPGSLLEQCIALCQPQEARVEPVRTIHQMACTGGTLFAKCIAAMPNVQLLSEVDPLSRMLDSDVPRFCPSDMVGLMRQASRGAADAVLVQMFQASLQVAHADASSRGERLVLRDHAHSQYCFRELERRPSLREMVSARWPVLPLVLVRHPLDSYASLHQHGWMAFEGGLDEYARRYMAFLDDQEDVPILRYEDFVRDPERRMREACEHLQLPFSRHFTEMFDIFRFSGDSGRRGNVIAPRERRQFPADLLARDHPPPARYLSLLKRLDYDE